MLYPQIGSRNPLAAIPFGRARGYSVAPNRGWRERVLSAQQIGERRPEADATGQRPAPREAPRPYQPEPLPAAKLADHDWCMMQFREELQ